MKKLADAAWKVADHGMDEVVVSSANDGECMTKKFIVRVPKFPPSTSVLASPHPNYTQSTVEKLSVEKGSSDCITGFPVLLPGPNKWFLKSHISLSNGTIALLLSYDVRANVIFMEALTNVAAVSTRTGI